MKPIIELKNVSVAYSKGESNETIALNDINLEIFEGEYIVFLGPSGCGKSTLLYTIAGLESATSGSVVVGGNDFQNIHEDKRIHFYRETIGMVFQAFYLVPHLSAKDNMMLSKMFSRASVEEREKRVNELMNKFDIMPYANHKPAMMSGGQQQRTAIGRALMNDPEIILADEPVGNLDSKNALVVLELLSDINKKEGKTIIQVTHNPRDAHYADRVFYMKDGAIERIVVNPNSKKYDASSQSEMSEFEKLAEMNPSLSQTQLEAKYIMRSLLIPYDINTEQKVENIIEKYINKEVSKDELLNFIDDSKKGAGLYSQKARRISHDIEDIVLEIENIRKARIESLKKTKAFASQVTIIRKHLLDHYEGRMSSEQIHKLELIIEARLNGEISSSDLKEALDIPPREGGLGLNAATAKKFSRYIELLISQ